MKKFLEFVSSNSLISALVCAAIIAIFRSLWNHIKNTKDNEKVFDFLKKSTVNTPHIFRSTEAIAAGTNLTESRVEAICAKHPRILRNTKEKQSWRLVE